MRHGRPLLLLCLLAAAALAVALAPAGALASGTAGGASVPGDPSTSAVQPSGSPEVPGGAVFGAVKPVASPPVGLPPRSSGVPRSYARLYQRAGQRYRVSWRVLAAIGHNESDHGRSRARGVASGLNYARCCAGPMQLCRVRACGLVWQHYAIDANHDGSRSVYDPADAIYAAAALLRDLTRQVGSSAQRLLAAYNAGPGAVLRYRGVPPYPETRAYVRAGVAYIATL